jgi:hypothetical protein
MLLTFLLALSTAEVVPWVLTGLTAVAALVASLARRSAAQAQRESVSTSAFEAVTKSQATYNLALSAENGALRERLTRTEEKCRDDLAHCEAVIETLELEVRTLRQKVRTLEEHGS